MLTSLAAENDTVKGKVPTRKRDLERNLRVAAVDVMKCGSGIEPGDLA